MIVSITEKEYLQAKELEKLGIPLDNEFLRKSRAVLSGLYIDQDFNIPQTTIFDTNSGGTGIQITLSIQNCTDRTICLCTARLNIPWCNQLHWLEDPVRRAPAKHYYTVPICGAMRLERDLVLNHRLGPRSKLHPGDRLEGFLLGVAPERIPEEYIDRKLFIAKLSFFDSRNNTYTQQLNFLVCRTARKQEIANPKNQKIHTCRSRLKLGGTDVANVTSVAE